MNNTPDIQHLTMLLKQKPLVSIEQTGLANHGFASSIEFTEHRLWSLHFYQYSGILIVDSKAHRLRPNNLSLIPPGMTANWQFPEDAPHYYVHFKMQPINAQSYSAILIDCHEQTNSVLRSLQDTVHHFSLWPEASAARLLNMLWSIVLTSDDTPPAIPSNTAVQIATSYIRNEIYRPLRVKDIAKLCGVSPGHLSKQFKSVYCESVQEYIQRARIQKVRQLMKSSDLNITSIAHAVGIPDLQAFNKFIRKRLGQSPRELLSTTRYK